jgi:hypothetical protein
LARAPIESKPSAAPVFAGKAVRVSAAPMLRRSEFRSCKVQSPRLPDEWLKHFSMVARREQQPTRLSSLWQENACCRNVGIPCVKRKRFLINKVDCQDASFNVASLDFGCEVSSHYIWISFARSIGRAMDPQSAGTPKFFRCALFICDYTQAIEMGKIGGQPAPAK